MADTFTYEIDTSQWETLMGELNARKLKAAWKSGLRPSAKKIERGVLTQLSAKHPNAAKYSKELKVKIWSKGGGYTVGLSKGQIEFAMNKAGKLVEKSHLYILRWLAGGTKERFTKRGARRGSIAASHFFREGVQQNIQPAIDGMAGDITKALQRAAQRARAAKANPQK